MKTWSERVDIEIDKVKGSRFIGAGCPVGSEAEAEAFVREVQTIHRKATHTAFAWVLEDGRARCGDDGEVSGTAGPPGLARIEGAGLRGVALTVTRYYGGVNLGKGGLVRAYGATAAAIIAAAPTLEVEDRVHLDFHVDTARGSSVLAVLPRYGFQVLDALWGERVKFALEGPLETAEDLRVVLEDVARGTLTWDDVE